MILADRLRFLVKSIFVFGDFWLVFHLKKEHFNPKYAFFVQKSKILAKFTFFKKVSTACNNGLAPLWVLGFFGKFISKIKICVYL